MEYIDGITLKQYVKENGTLSFKELLPLMKPIIQALNEVHRRGLLHRDISPENLMVGIDNQLHLIDFGAASIENRREEKNMTVILKSGYAPPEQYLSDGKQGAWTDIYALCATMYMTLTGFAPPESIRRIQEDSLLPLTSHADITSWQAAAIEKGMSINAADRFQNMEALYQALIIPPIKTDSKHRSYQSTSIETNKTVMKKVIPAKGHRKTLYALFLVVLLFATLFTTVMLSGGNPFSLSGRQTGSPSTLKGSLNSILLTVSRKAEASTEASTEDTLKDTAKDTTENDSAKDKKSDSPNTQAATSGKSIREKSTREKSNFEIIPIEEEDEYSTITID